MLRNLNNRLTHVRCPKCGLYSATWKGGLGVNADRGLPNYIYHCKSCGNTFVKPEADRRLRY